MESRDRKSVLERGGEIKLGFVRLTNPFLVP